MTDIEKQKLLPCPFCGGEAQENWSYDLYIISCDTACSDKAEYTKELAYKTWNTRAQSAELLTANDKINLLKAALEKCYNLLHKVFFGEDKGCMGMAESVDAYEAAKEVLQKGDNNESNL